MIKFKRRVVRRTKKGRFSKGCTGNANGRPKGAKTNPAKKMTDIQLLRAALKKTSKKKDKNLFEHFVERAYESDTVLIGVMRKVVPDLKSLEALIAGVYDEMPDEMAADIRTAMKARFL